MTMTLDGLVIKVFVSLGSSLVEFGLSIRNTVLILLGAVFVVLIIYAWSESSKRDREDARKEWEFNR